MAKQEWFCEAGLGIDDSGVSPTIIMCRKPAKIYKLKSGPLIGFEITLCEEHKELANVTLDSHK